MPFEVAVRTNSDGREGKSLSNGEIFWLQYSTFSYGGEGFNKKIQCTKFNVKKRNSHEFLFYFSDAIKRGISVLLHQKSIYEKGWDKI